MPGASIHLAPGLTLLEAYQIATPGMPHIVVSAATMEVPR